MKHSVSLGFPVGHEMATVSQVLAEGVQHHKAGRLQAAEQIYRQILQADPRHADAHHLLGFLAHQTGHIEAAISLMRQAIALNPQFPDYHFNLGTILKDHGQLAEATACFRQALRLNPNHIDAHNNLGLALQDQGQLAEAMASFQQAMRINPRLPGAYNNIGNALVKQGRLPEAIASYQQALSADPNHADTNHNLGSALLTLGQYAEAVACYRQALHANPQYAQAHFNLGIGLVEMGQVGEAITSYREALRLNPNYGQAYNNLAIALYGQGELAESAECCRQALRINPNHVNPHINLGNVLKEQGQLDEALAYYRQARELEPNNIAAHSCYVYTLYCCPGQDAVAIHEEHRQWHERHAEPLAKFIVPHANDKSPDRRLRLGYISPDLRGHPVGRFLLPLLEAHDHGQFEVFCYSSVKVPDTLTAACRAHADVWRDIRGASDEQTTALVRADRIDILVDLTMHMAGNHLLVFARKPAPVQVTYLAYCGTTGLRSMDYRLTDPYLDSPGQNEAIYSEKSIYLPETYWCYKPGLESPETGAPPALAAGHATFGCLNNFCKVTAPTLETWSRLLETMPDARLLLLAPAGGLRDRVRNYYSLRGIGVDRLIFVDRVPMVDYYRTHQRIDVALDPFPHGGGTTTCDALWMGVPVVTLAGQTAVGRGGVSILSNVGLADLVARNVDDYVRIACELARDRPRLTELRATLRARMRKSSLMDAPRFARNIEAAYRGMWQQWCKIP